MKLLHNRLEIAGELMPLALRLEALKQQERVPPPKRRSEARRRLLDSYLPIRLSVIETKIGWIGLAWTPDGLAGLQLPRKSKADAMRELRENYREAGEAQAPREMVRQLTDYAERRRRAFDLSLDWSAIKPFQRSVLKATSKIPCGETRSYGWVARQIGKPRASRAVGHALATNPIPIVLPCHRVIGSDGGLHGYGGGLPMKAMLLRLEGAAFTG